MKYANSSRFDYSLATEFCSLTHNLGRTRSRKKNFLKHLAIECIEDRWQSDKVPFFIFLGYFADTSGEPRLLDYIESWFEIDTSTIQSILNQGRALILLDGLDEVRANDRISVKKRIRQFIGQFSFYNNIFVITCRIAATECSYEQFTDVKMADFESSQITSFVENRFKDSIVQAKRFLEKLNALENEPIRELAKNPLLLTLLCLVFEKSGFPKNCSDLYENGLNVFLKEWDAQRYIERDPIRVNLSLRNTKKLLNEIAYSNFQRGNFRFRQRELEGEIAEFIRNLQGASAE